MKDLSTPIFLPYTWYAISLFPSYRGSTMLGRCYDILTKKYDPAEDRFTYKRHRDVMFEFDGYLHNRGSLNFRDIIPADERVLAFMIIRQGEGLSTECPHIETMNNIELLREVERQREILLAMTPSLEEAQKDREEASRETSAKGEARQLAHPEGTSAFMNYDVFINSKYHSRIRREWNGIAPQIGSIFPDNDGEPFDVTSIIRMNDDLYQIKLVPHIHDFTSDENCACGENYSTWTAVQAGR